MKTQILALFIAISAFACKDVQPNPIVVSLDGKWKLIKTGFDHKIPGTMYIPKMEEIIEFNSTTKIYKKTIDGKLIESKKIIYNLVDGENNFIIKNKLIKRTTSFSFESSDLILINYQNGFIFKNTNVYKKL